MGRKLLEVCYTELMDEVKEILNNHFPGKEWEIGKPVQGASKESFIARSDDQTLFIKLDVNRGVLDRLSELGIAPKVIAEGENPRPYIVQAYIDGSHPEWSWFQENLVRLATVFKTFHNDSIIKELLGGEKDYDDHVNQQLEQVEKIYPILMKTCGDDELENMFQMFRVQTEHLTVTPMVPVHPDPNDHNIILTSEKIYLVDWDDVLLSDPMHDIGLLLFWYVPRERWQEFFTAYGTEMDKNRIYWWIACRSFGIAHWFHELGDKEKTKIFLNNFKAAVMKEENPGWRDN